MACKALAPLLALACAGGVAAFAAAPAGDGWKADPDTQYLLDVNIRQKRLGEGVRAYPTPAGHCVILGDFITVVDAPVSIDLAAGKASGWAFREEHRLAIDRTAGTVQVGAEHLRLAPGTIRDTPEGWCVDGAALGRWFGVEVKLSPSASLLELVSPAKLPVELAQERALRARNLRPAALPLEGLPQVKLPYRMWRAPALDFIVSAGATYNAGSGLKVDRRASIAAAGEIAKMSYDATISSSADRALGSVRVHAYRSDPDGELLGPLGATHFGVGDVSGSPHRLIGGMAGRGVEVTNRPLFNPAAFDRTRFEGDLPSGWDAEIYRNGQLLGFFNGDGSQRYHFDDVQLLYGDNRFEILLYGPQGQVRSRVETLNVGQSHVPPGKTWYWAGINQPGRDLLGFSGNSATASNADPRSGIAFPKVQAVASVEHGLDQKTSLAALASMMIVGDEKLTFVEGSVRRSIGPALVEIGVAKQSGGGIALRGQAIAKLGPVNLSGEALALNEFYYQGRIETRMRDIRFALDAPVKLGRQTVSAHGDIRYTDRDGSKAVEAKARLSTNFNAVNLAAEADWRRTRPPDGDPLDQFDLSLLGTGRVGPVRLRARGTWQVAPQARLSGGELSAYWSASDKADWEGAVAYENQSKRARARISHIRRFNAVAAAASVEAASDGSFAVGLNLNFSLDRGATGMRFSREPLAGSGRVEARVYRDLNDNGVRDGAEPWEAGAVITAGMGIADRPSDKNGNVRVTGLTPYRPVVVGIDASSLTDPSLAPRKALQAIVPRAGIATRIDIGLVGAGDIEGALVHDDGRGIEGLEVEMIDAAGKIVATTRTDYDGFFLFERAPYGEYRFRLTQASAEAAKLLATLDATASISATQTIVRLGAIRVRAPPRLAAAY